LRPLPVAIPALLTAACTAQHPTQAGPTFGGDQRAHAALAQLASGTLPDTAPTEAGILAAWPVAIPRVRCDEGLCLDARAAWLPDDDLLVAVGVDAVADRADAHVAFALDASGSVDGYEDVRAASVEVALEQLDDDDELAVWAFTGVAVPLVASAPVDAAHRATVRTALHALDQLPVVRQLVATTEGCDDDSLDALLRCAPHVDGEGPDPQALEALSELVASSPDEALGDRLLALARDDGSAIDEAAATVLETLPDGGVHRASRFVLVSDLGGPSATEAVSTAAERYVGTSVLGLTPTADPDQAAQLATAPGAHTLDAVSPAHALAAWEARFDALIYPLAWGVGLDLHPDSEAHWVLERRVGTTDAEGLGANALFASTHHGILGAVLRPVRDDPPPPRLVLTLDTPAGEVAGSVASLVPRRWITTDWGEGDDEVALAVAWRLALRDAIEAGDEEEVAALMAERRPAGESMGGRAGPQAGATSMSHP